MGERMCYPRLLSAPTQDRAEERKTYRLIANRENSHHFRLYHFNAYLRIQTRIQELSGVLLMREQGPSLRRM